MKCRRTKRRVERYAGLVSHFENKMNVRLHRWADVLQLQSDRLSRKQKYIVFMIGCTSVAIVFATIIINAFK